MIKIIFFNNLNIFIVLEMRIGYNCFLFCYKKIQLRLAMGSKNGIFSVQEIESIQTEHDQIGQQRRGIGKQPEPISQS